MKFFVERGDKGKAGCFGTLNDENGAIICSTMERTDMIIPAGEYECERYDSPHLGYIVWRLKDVPGRTNIEIHKANWQDQLLGCIALGMAVQPDFDKGLELVRSRDAFDKFMELTKPVDKITIVIHDR